MRWLPKNPARSCYFGASDLADACDAGVGEAEAAGVTEAFSPERALFSASYSFFNWSASASVM